MMRIPHYLCFAVGIIAVSIVPAVAETHAPSHRGHHAAQTADGATPQLTNPVFYGAFGGYAEANAAAQFSGPGERHYFGFAGAAADGRTAYESLIEQHASANGIPASLVHRVIMRESRYNPRAVNAGNYGIMQIRLGTARAMGYSGSAAGLLDAETNITYAVKYLAGAYRAAHGNENLAVALYARGY